MTSHLSSRTPHRFTLLLLLPILLFWLAPDCWTYARAGGGQSYSRSSSSSGSSSSSRSGSSSKSKDSYTTTTNTFPTGRSNSVSDGQPSFPSVKGRYHIQAGPPGTFLLQKLFLCLVFGLALLFVIDRRQPIPKFPAYAPIANIELNTKVSEDHRKKAILEQVKSRDAQFVEPDFIKRVSIAFSNIQAAWTNQDLSQVQAFLSDGVFERFSLQIQALKQDCIRDVMNSLSVLDSRIVSVDSDAHFDTLHVLFRASAVNYRENLDSGCFLEGSRVPEVFSEVWSFLRCPGATTRKKPGLIEGFCPNCSAPIEIARAATCKACNAFLRSGEHDWVLSEITQTCEWFVHEPGNIPGLKAMRAADKGFNLQHIEDRVSVMFWRMMCCYRAGEISPLLKYASGSFSSEFSKRLAADKSGKRTSYVHPAVGSVDVLLVSLAEPADQVVVEVRWSGVPFSVDASGKVLPPPGRSVNPHDLFVLKRQHGVTTDTRLSLSSATCPGCGAPETSALANVCPYCNSSYNDGSRDWVLDQLLKKTDRPFIKLRQSVVAAETSPNASGSSVPVAPPPGPIRSPADALRWMAALMFADGVASATELEILREFADKQKIPPKALETIVTAAKDGVKPPEMSSRPHEVLGILNLLVTLAMRDGTISREEHELIRLAGKKARIAEIDIQKIIADEQKRQTPV